MRRGMAIAGLVLIIIGGALLIIGPATDAIIRHAKDGKIERTVVIHSYDDKKYEDWKSNGQDTDPIRYRIFHVFNLTNPAEVEKGAIPIVKEVGPYAYQV